MSTMTTKSGRTVSVGAIIWNVLKYVILVFFSLVAVVPIITCVITAFKSKEEY